MYQYAPGLVHVCNRGQCITYLHPSGREDGVPWLHQKNAPFLFLFRSCFGKSMMDFPKQDQSMHHLLVEILRQTSVAHITIG